MLNDNITIRLEKEADYRNTENLTREAFWNVYRPDCTEHYVLHCYRDDPAFVPELDFVMEQAKKMGAGALAITGNILFYGKSGFVTAKTKGVRYADDPNADYFLIKELTPGFLNGIFGTYKDPEGYFVCEKDPAAFERFEAEFPKKQKLKLPGQLF